MRLEKDFERFCFIFLCETFSSLMMMLFDLGVAPFVLVFCVCIFKRRRHEKDNNIHTNSHTQTKICNENVEMVTTDPQGNAPRMPTLQRVGM